MNFADSKMAVVNKVRIALIQMLSNLAMELLCKGECRNYDMTCYTDIVVFL